MYRGAVFMSIAIVALSLSLWLSIDYGIRKSKECTRLEQNQQGLLSDIREYKIRDSISVSSIRVLTMTNSELKTNFTSLTSVVRELGIKLSRLEAVSESKVESTYSFSAPIADSTARFATPHIDFRAKIDGSVLKAEIRSVDTLRQIVHRVPKRFWFIRYGTKYIEQEIFSSNPNTHLVYGRYIKVK